MYTCLSTNELSILSNWDLYKQRNVPVSFIANEIPNVIFIHKVILDSGMGSTLISDVLPNVVCLMQTNTFIIEQITEELLTLKAETIIKEIELFQKYLNSIRCELKWSVYKNCRGNSTVKAYRIGPDFIDVIFSTSPSYYYHYSYKLTNILNTEFLKELAIQGAFLGANTRRIKQGMFEKHLIE